MSLHSNRGKTVKFGSKNKPQRKKLSKNERRKLNLFNFDKSEIKYRHFVKLNNLWNLYIKSLLPTKNNVNLKVYHDVLLRADYHGAKLRVKHSRAESQIGIEGIVALETKNLFHLGINTKFIVSSTDFHPVKPRLTGDLFFFTL